MTEMERNNAGQEVIVPEPVDELAFRAIRANDEHYMCGRDLGGALEHALSAGGHLNAAQAELRLRTGKQVGGWDDWLRANFDGHPSTAYEYQRLDREREKFSGIGENSAVTIGEARRILSPPKEKSKEGAPEGVSAQSVRLRQEAIERAEKALKEKKAATKRAKDRLDEIKKLKASQKEREKAISEQLKANLQEELSEVYARYGIEESPSIFEVDPAAFAKAVENSRNEREVEALELLEQAFALVSKMRQYEPEEAARAFLKWPSHERSQEAIEEITEWLQSCRQEIEMQVSPGKLRVVGAKGE